LYVFLDFDGVLNSSRYLMANEEQLRHHKSQHLVFDPDAMELLNMLLLRHPVEVVIASDWRKARPFGVLAERMTIDGFRYPHRVIGQTPNYGDAPRGREIHAWLMARNFRGKPFVVLDDRDDMDEVDSHHVKIDPIVGITKADVNKATKVLSRGKK
jgi:HAD domain in Swiss Army Knife RNA repair proteins